MRTTVADPPLRGRRILVIEDEEHVVEAMQDLLTEAGAAILGPAGTVSAALALLHTGRFPDLAVLDLNLHEEFALPVADMLATLGIPFVVTTGYGAIGDLAGHHSVPVLAKPYAPAALVRALGRLCLQRPGAPAG